MPQGDKSSYTSKQRRQAAHIEDSEKKSGRSTRTAERIAWATVNKQDGGAKGKKSSRRSRTASRQRKATKRPASRTSRSTRTTRARA